MHPANVSPSSVAHSRKMDAGSLQHLSQGGQVGYLCIFVRARVSRAWCEAAAGWLACPQRGKDGGDKALQQPLLLAAEGRGTFPETRGPAGCWGWKMWCECGCSDETLGVCLSPVGISLGVHSKYFPRLSSWAWVPQILARSPRDRRSHWSLGAPHGTQGAAEPSQIRSFSCPVKAELRLRFCSGFGAIFLFYPQESHGHPELHPPVHPEAASQANFGHKGKKAPESAGLAHSTHPKEMPHGNRKADGEGRGAQVVLPALVGGSEDAQDQLEGEEELDRHRLPCRRLVVQLERGKKRVLWTERVGDGFGNVEGTPRDLGLADIPLFLLIILRVICAGSNTMNSP